MTTAIEWDKPGSRFFEAGVDRGVLYVEGSDGVPWNGLVSVSEASTGAEVTPYYIDGQRYMNSVSLEEFEATIEAFTYPDEFLACDGSDLIANGLIATQQRRMPFGLCYRTIIGNDIDGRDFGYKLHLIYNARAELSDRANASLSDEIDPENFSWHIVATPPDVAGIKPTSHFVIDSTKTPVELMAQVEAILYGSMDVAATLPSVADLINLFKMFNTLVFDAGRITDISGAVVVEDPIYHGSIHTVDIPVVSNVTYTLNGTVVSPGSFSVSDDTIIIATPTGDVETTAVVIDAGNVTDPAPTTVYDGGEL